MISAYMESILCLTHPLKLAEGKTWLVPHLKPVCTQYRRRGLIELFCYGLVVEVL